MGSDLGAATALAWSTDILLEWIFKRLIFEVLRSYMVSFAMAALRSVFFIQR